MSQAPLNLTSDSPPPGQALATATFPLRVSANGRYLEGQNGVPFRIQGDSPWDASVVMNQSEWIQYLDDRKSKGFNTVVLLLTDPVRYDPISTAPHARGAGGALPFLKNTAGGTWDGDPIFAGDFNAHQPAPGNFDADFSSPNGTYFAWIDTMITLAQARGIVVMVSMCYLGFANGAQDGWWRTLNNSANTQAKSFGFGQFLGNRYKNFTNIVWVAGGDMAPAPGAEGSVRALKILDGIRAAGDTHLRAGHWVHDYLSTDVAAFAPSMDLEGVYSHGPYPVRGPTYARSLLGYSQQPARPAIFLETNYENEHGATAADIREYMWGAELSTVGGVMFGNSPLWKVGPGWQSALGSVGSFDMMRLGAVLDSSPWYQLVPSGLAGTKTIITSGTGTFTSMANVGDSESGGDDWVPSAATPGGTHIVAYVPHVHQGPIGVDMTVLSSTSRARWYDPTNGTLVAIGNFPPTGTRLFTVPGTNSGGGKDWVLLLDPVSVAVPAMSTWSLAVLSILLLAAGCRRRWWVSRSLYGLAT